jgi:hypothetical protein
MTALITAAELGAYTGNLTDSQADLRDTFARGASEIVAGFLNYDPNESVRDEFFDSIGGIRLALNAKPIAEIAAVSFRLSGSWVAQDVAAFFIRGQYLFLSSGDFPNGEATVHVVYRAGYAPAEIPGIMKITALRIAGVLAAESDGNIGITSKSFGDSGSRVFLNSKFDRYLEPLEDYRITKI